jgi:hypothetical protein
VNQLRELLRTCDRASGGAERQGVFLKMTREEKALLEETAYRCRSTQAGVLRTGLRLVARDVLEGTGGGR